MMNWNDNWQTMKRISDVSRTLRPGSPRKRRKWRSSNGNTRYLFYNLIEKHKHVYFRYWSNDSKNCKRSVMIYTRTLSHLSKKSFKRLISKNFCWSVKWSLWPIPLKRRTLNSTRFWPHPISSQLRFLSSLENLKMFSMPRMAQSKIYRYLDLQTFSWLICRSQLNIYFSTSWPVSAKPTMIFCARTSQSCRPLVYPLMSSVSSPLRARWLVTKSARVQPVLSLPPHNTFNTLFCYSQ